MQSTTDKICCLIVLAFLLIVSTGCERTRYDKSRYRSWKEIKESGFLRVLTLYNSTSYFIYRGYEMGCEYELAKQFANNHNLEIKVITAPDFENLTKMLHAGKGDVIAYDMPITLKHKEMFLYCGPEMITHQVLVQRRDSSMLSHVKNLIGKDVYVEKSSKYEVRAHNLSKELGGGIKIYNSLSDTASTDGFIEAVANGWIDYTIADNVIATLNKSYYHNLDVSVDVGFAQRSAWLVTKTSKELADSINSWVDKTNRSKKYLSTMRKYFRMSKWGNEHASPFGMSISMKKGIISPFDNLFKRYSKDIGWDWRMLAAIAYYESKFDSTLVSWAGAKGLMQLMPKTAESFGDEGWNMQNNEHNVITATRNIAALNQSLSKIKDKNERIKFILAAYNSGIGHVFDAMALAEKYGKNPLVWDKNVAETILMKSKPEYFNDPVCKCGYFKGRETTDYVVRVIELFKYYKLNMNK
ncbi:MAG: transporter substrate-binding domain-containing protein [Bacteroidales bacterium]